MLRLGVGHPKKRQRAGKQDPLIQEGLGTAGGDVTDVGVLEPTEEPVPAIN